MDDDKDIKIPIPGTDNVPDGDSVLSTVVDWIAGHGTISAAIVLGIVGVGIYQRHKVLATGLGVGMLVFLIMSIKN